MAAKKKSPTNRKPSKIVNKKPSKVAGKPLAKQGLKQSSVKKAAPKTAKKAAKKPPAKKSTAARKPAAGASKKAKGGGAASGKKKAVARRTAAVKRKPVAKKPVAKKEAATRSVAARKPAAVKRPVGAKKAVNAKAAASVKPAARPAVAAARKPAGKKPVAEAVRPPVRPAPFGRVPVRPSRPARKGKPVKKLSAKELARYRKALLDLRDQVVDDISFLAGDNLNRSQRETSGDLSGYSFHMADQGTDNYDREFALNLVSSEQDVLYEIDEAIRRMDNGTYGVCELSGEPIERARLNVLPYARCSVAAQSELERGRTRYRPFGPTLSHGG